MQEQKTDDCDDIAITQLTTYFAIDLMKHSYFEGSDALKQGLKNKILQSIKLNAHTTKLVAYHIQDKTAIGFLCLKENTKDLFLIEKVFVHPNYRKRGIATKLLNYAFSLAKAKGAKKVNLNVYPTLINAINLYKRLGFEEIGTMLLAQGPVLGLGHSRVIRRIIAGKVFLLPNKSSENNSLSKLKTNSEMNKERLFDVYQDSVDKVWIDFFEINSKNLINGSRHVWQPKFFKDVLINKSGDSVAIVFNNPIYGRANVEVYSSNKNPITLISDLLKVLSNRGTGFTQITMPNYNEGLLDWFESKDMQKYQFICMGKML